MAQRNNKFLRQFSLDEEANNIMDKVGNTPGMKMSDWVCRAIKLVWKSDVEAFNRYNRHKEEMKRFESIIKGEVPIVTDTKGLDDAINDKIKCKDHRDEDYWGK